MTVVELVTRQGVTFGYCASCSSFVVNVPGYGDEDVCVCGTDLELTDDPVEIRTIAIAAMRGRR